jgi:hypothetical protein
MRLLVPQLLPLLMLVLQLLASDIQAIIVYHKIISDEDRISTAVSSNLMSGPVTLLTFFVTIVYRLTTIYHSGFQTILILGELEGIQEITRHIEGIWY